MSVPPNDLEKQVKDLDRRLRRDRWVLVVVGSVAALGLPFALSANVVIPHTFSGGTVAQASTVNENFATLAAAVDANAADQLNRGANDWSGFVEKTAPVDNDLVLIEDSEASFAKKKVKKSAIAGGAAPSVTRYTSGSGNYPVPAGTRFLRVKMAGGGGGGAAGAAGSNPGAGNSGANTTFGTNTCNGGSGASTGGTGGFAGSCSVVFGTLVNTYAMGGRHGSFLLASSNGYAIGGAGGSNLLAAGGVGEIGGGTSQSGSIGGGGGAGGGANSGTAYVSGGGGGGAGGATEFIVSAPAATYAYSVGAGGTGVGTGGSAGAAGGNGIIIIEAY